MIRAIARQAERFPELDIAPLNDSGLSELDAAFAHAIYDSVLRRWLTLEYIVSLFLHRPLTSMAAGGKAALLCGAAQLLLMDKVPPHAALFETVEWAKANLPGKVPDAINAVLRRVAELVERDPSGTPIRQPWEQRRDRIPLSDGLALVLKEPVLPEDPVIRMIAGTSHPRVVVERWAADFGEAAMQGLAAHGLMNPPTVLNTAFAGDIAALIASGVPLKPHDEPGCHVWEGSRRELITLLGSRNDLWVQDAASTRAVKSTAGLKPGLVIDLCAGQGTKTRQLAKTFRGARVVATDVDPRRYASLAEEAGRTRLFNAVAPGDIGREFTGTADLILLDVPCTNTGVLARRIEARYRANREQLLRMVEVQKTIVSDALRLLSPRGVILYSTCSLEREENEDQVAWMETGGMKVVSKERVMPTGMPGDGAEKYRDGAFSAILEPPPR